MTTPRPTLGQAASHHPRPQLRREGWQSLNGTWRFLFDDAAVFAEPKDIFSWPLMIEVPFAPETALSGVGDTGFHEVCWYQRDLPAVAAGTGRVLLHFGAVDYQAKVWVDHQYVGCHRGGHTPFSFDITTAISSPGVHRVTVRAEDDPHDLAKPRGKQDWQLHPHSIWYPRTSGIWQMVWLETVPQQYLARLRWTPHVERWEIAFEAYLGQACAKPLQLRLRLSVRDQLLVNDTYQVTQGAVHRRIALSDPGIDDFRNELLWSPERPTLIQAELELWDEHGCIDQVRSYTALRSVGTQHGDFLLNGRPYYLRLVLDQGYWPESLLTPPDSEAFKTDIQLVKAMGFNGVRKHQKVEAPAFLYWADTLGLIVWEEMPSAYRFTHEGVERIVSEWTEVIDRDYSHPCIAVWVPFNESWGVPDLSMTMAHRSCIQALYHLTKTLDPSRLAIGNDGWESSATDILGLHDYDNHPERMKERYGPGLSTSEILQRRSPAGRMRTVEGFAPADQPIMLTEFGGIAYTRQDRHSDPKAWGYGVSENLNELRRLYYGLLKTVHELNFFRGFCYTQLTDTFQEANGLLYADRTPKLPIAEIASVTCGSHEERLEVTIDSPHLVPPSLM